MAGARPPNDSVHSVLFYRHMAKALAISVLIVPLLIARQAVRLRDPRRGLRRTVLLAVAFNALYVLALIFFYFRLA